jgi:hypothetical protein
MESLQVRKMINKPNPFGLGMLHLFSLEEFDGITPPMEILFEQAALDDDGIGLGKYLQERVKIDLTKPVARGHLINLLGKYLWVPFQYERLPHFFFSLWDVLSWGSWV